MVSPNFLNFVAWEHTWNVTIKLETYGIVAAQAQWADKTRRHYYVRTEHTYVIRRGADGAALLVDAEDVTDALWHLLQYCRIHNEFKEAFGEDCINALWEVFDEA